MLTSKFLVLYSLLAFSTIINLNVIEASTTRTANSCLSPNTSVSLRQHEVQSRALVITRETTVLSGMTLAFNSGFVNGCCLSGGLFSVNNPPKQGTSAVTGAWTLSALAFATRNSEQFMSQIRIIASYIFGSFLASVITPKAVPFQVTRTSGAVTFFLGSFLLLIASRMAFHSKVMSCFILAAIANGMQNSFTSLHTTNLVRSAHLSGMSSDIGSILGQVVRGNYENIYKLKIFLLLSASFWSGGYVSYIVTKQMGSKSLLLSSILYFIIGAGLTIDQFI